MQCAIWITFSYLANGKIVVDHQRWIINYTKMHIDKYTMMSMKISKSNVIKVHYIKNTYQIPGSNDKLIISLDSNL